MSKDNNMIEWFRASTAYINAHRGKVFVVLLGGEALSESNLANIVYDLSLLHSLGVKLVLVHGARPQISEALQAAGIESRYHRNLRITEASSMALVRQTVGGLCTELDARFSMGLTTSPLHGAHIRLARGNFVTARPVGIHDGIDYHYTGKVRRIQADAIRQQLDMGNLVLLSNLGYSLTGEVYNLSAEEVATETAIALRADKLILMLPTEGVHNAEGELLAALNERDAEDNRKRLARNSDDESVCIAHALQAALQAYRGGVHRIHLISFRDNGALLQELFTREGNGSLLASDSYDQLRPATAADVAGILALIRPLEENGALVQRSRERLENEIDNFKLIELEGSIVACAALYPISDEAAELACIAIHPSYQKMQMGSRLLRSLETEATRRGIRTLFVLTTVTDHWFLEHGFVASNPEALPETRQKLYNYQRNSKVLRKELKD
ncbi:MAG: amino-acid N-acetyltransferase [Pseudohongiellaceae bacterium]